MAAKTEAKEAAPAAEKSAPAAAEAAAPASAARTPWIAVILVVVLAPALSLGVAQFVLLPRLRKSLAISPPSVAPAAAAPAAAGEAGAAAAGADRYEFTNLVVNLAGTMGTRYLKTSFVVTGDATLHAAFDTYKDRLKDVTLNVLSSCTLADLDEPGSRNVLRERLVAAYNENLGHKVADQVYFSDFVVQ